MNSRFWSGAFGVAPRFKQLVGLGVSMVLVLAGSGVGHAQLRLDGPGNNRDAGIAAVLAATNKYTSSDGFTHWRQDVNTGCQYSDHSFTLDIDADPADMTQIRYTMTNYDVDFVDPQGACPGGPEVDVLSLNSQQLGVLAGANNSWSVNSYPLSSGQVTTGSNAVHIDTDSTGTGCWCVGVGYIEVQAKVGFTVEKTTPTANEKNRAFKAAALDLSVEFSSEYDPATLNSSTVLLEYRDAGGSWQQVSGSFTSLSPEKFRFDPSGDLKDGVRYRATVKSGTGGVLSTAGVPLPADEQWFFWTVPDLDVTDAFGGSACAPSSSPCAGVEIAVFQVARNAALSIGKNAVARAYMRWKKHTDVMTADQISELEADLKLTGGGITTTASGKLKRPDLWTATDRKSAANSINIYHLPTSGASYTLEITPKPQSNATPVIYNGSQPASSNGAAPTLEFDYYFLKDGNWAGGVPASAKTSGLALLTAGAQTTTDLFPVRSTTYNQRGDFSASYSYTGSTTSISSCGAVAEVSCPHGTGSSTQAELLCVYQTLSTMLGGHSMVAASVPNTLCPGATAFVVGKVFMAQDGAGANDGTVAHEIGHVFGLVGHRNASNGVEGFQVRTQTNRSYTDDPSIAVSLMHEFAQPSGTQWIDNSDYNSLLGVAGTFRVRAPYAPSVAASSGPWFIVSGLVNFVDNEIVVYPAYLQDEASDFGSGSGQCAVRLLDSANDVLAETFVDPGVEIIIEKSDGSGETGRTPDSAALFSVALPWDEAAASVRMDCGAGLEATLTRTPDAPAIVITGPADGATVSGVVTASWDASDVDGDILVYQAQASVDGGASWDPLTTITARNSLDLDTSLFANGPMLLRVMTSDGFNVSYGSVSLTISNSLAVHSVLPVDGATGVSLTTTVDARFVSPVDPATIDEDSFTLRTAAGTVPASVAYDPDTQTATLTLSAPLAPDTLHTAGLTARITGANGEAFAPLSWTFTTAPDLQSPSVIESTPHNGDTQVPLNSLIQVRFDEEVDAGSLDPFSIGLYDASDMPVETSIAYVSGERRAVLVPAAGLEPDQEYAVRVGEDVRDLAGNTLAGLFEARFTTGDEVSPGVRIVGDYSDSVTDTDGDGLYESLNISTEVEVLYDGTYNLNGRLLDSSNRLIEWTSSGNVYLRAGVHRLVLTFGSMAISNSGLDGPYTLDALNFYSTSNPSVADVSYSAYETAAYDVTQFASVMRVGPIPDQLLPVDTVLVDAFNLRALTTHVSEPVESISYEVVVNSDPRVEISIDSETNVSIYPEPGAEIESDVTIEASDPLGNKVQSRFHVSVQTPRPSELRATYEATMAIDETQPIAVDVVDQFGALYPQSVTLVFEPTLGTVTPATVTTNTGQAETTFNAGTTAGRSFVTVSTQGGSVENVLQIDIEDAALGYEGRLLSRDIVRLSTRDGMLVLFELTEAGVPVTTESVKLELLRDRSGTVVRSVDLYAPKVGDRYKRRLDLDRLSPGSYTLRATVGSTGDAFTKPLKLIR